MTLAARQRAQTKRELERDQRRKARARLVELRTQLKAAKQRKRERMKQVSCNCKKARNRIRARARAARKRLSASIQRTKLRAKELCGLARHEARAEGLAEIGRTIDALNEERKTQTVLRTWTAPPARHPQRSRREVATESDDVVRANIDDPGLRIVWEHVKSRIKAGPRRSRTEAFFEWAAEHTADVYAIQEADAEREIRELEREYRALAKTGSRRPARTAVPF